MFFWARLAILFIVLIHSKAASDNMLYNMEDLVGGGQ